jgi:hypothetical protein
MLQSGRLNIRRRFFQTVHPRFRKKISFRVPGVNNIIEKITCGSLKGRGGCANTFPGFVSMVTASDVDSSLSAILLEY